MTQLNLGRIRMRFVGDYSASAEYVPTDIVRDPAGGSLYVPKVANVPAGTALTNTAFFNPMLLTAGLSKTGHQHTKSEITDFNEADYAPAVHDHLLGEVTGLQAALDSKAPLASPALSGTPTAPTAAQGTDTTQIATTAFVVGALNALLNGAPAALDTLQELAAAIADDADFAATITAQLGLKANSADLGTAAAQAIEAFATAAQGTKADAAMPKAGGDFTGPVKTVEVRETVADLTGTTPTVDVAAGTSFKLTTSGNTTFAFAAPPQRVVACALALRSK